MKTIITFFTAFFITFTFAKAQTGEINYYDPEKPSRPENFKPFFFKYNTVQLYEQFSEDLMQRAAKDVAEMKSVNDKGNFKPEIESLNKHEMPEWFEDAKLGLFLDWGPWSVPGYAPPRDPELGTGGSYPDWYEFLMNYTYKHYHDSVWGEDFRRDDFLPLLHGKNFDAEEYVQMAEDIGAKYIVPFSRHHAGWTMWDSDITFRNAVEMGPGRDIYKEIAEAAREKDLKLGFYFSIAEWEYPVIVENRLSQWDPYENLAIFQDGMALLPRPAPYSSYFPAKHDRMISGKIPVKNYWTDYMMPLFKEGVDKFDPDLVWFDGGWGTPATQNKSPEMTAYFYNQAEGRKEVVVNNRAGAYLEEDDLRKIEELMKSGQHEKMLEVFGNAPQIGDYTTPEYQIREGETESKWEICRSISPAFGYNYTDNDENSLSSAELIKLLVETVATNGNLLLVINPDGSGKLSEVQRSRLKNLGNWMKVNQEGIHATRPWTVNEYEGSYFTKSKDDDHLYVHRLGSGGSSLTIPDLKISSKNDITILGTKEKLEWKQDRDNIVVMIPEKYQQAEGWPNEFGFTLKVEM